ncbi:dTDP-4-dehydrorhamnose reductase [Jatrophihabitans sp. YIM 134969]
MTRWLVTGARGQLGSRLVDALAAVGETEVVALGSTDLDVTDAAAVERTVVEVRPDVVVNAAAHTAVDAAETDVDAAYAVNRDGPAHLAATLARHRGRLVHVSTDYVFAGDADRPYEPADPTGPRTVYGASKLAGEQEVLRLLPSASVVVRSAWIFGGPGPNFVGTMQRLEREKDTIDVVSDQVGSPTAAPDLAVGLVELGRLLATGTHVTPVLHAVNSGVASWYDLARATFAAVGADPDRVHPTTSEAFVRPAPRPAWSVLSPTAWDSAGLTPLRPWTEALAAVVAESSSS